MFRFTRKATLANASYTPAAVAWAMELDGYLNKTYDIHLRAGLEMFGGLNVHWQFETDSIDKITAINQKLFLDKNYWAMIAKAKDFWVPGTLKDEIVNFPD